MSRGLTEDNIHNIEQWADRLREAKRENRVKSGAVKFGVEGEAWLLEEADPFSRAKIETGIYEAIKRGSISDKLKVTTKSKPRRESFYPGHEVNFGADFPEYAVVGSPRAEGLPGYSKGQYYQMLYRYGANYAVSAAGAIGPDGSRSSEVYDFLEEGQSVIFNEGSGREVTARCEFVTELTPTEAGRDPVQVRRIRFEVDGKDPHSILQFLPRDNLSIKEAAQVRLYLRENRVDVTNKDTKAVINCADGSDRSGSRAALFHLLDQIEKKSELLESNLYYLLKLCSIVVQEQTHNTAAEAGIKTLEFFKEFTGQDGAKLNEIDELVREDFGELQIYDPDSGNFVKDPSHKFDPKGLLQNFQLLPNVGIRGILEQYLKEVQAAAISGDEQVHARGGDLKTMGGAANAIGGGGTAGAGGSGRTDAGGDGSAYDGGFDLNQIKMAIAASPEELRRTEVITTSAARRESMTGFDDITTGSQQQSVFFDDVERGDQGYSAAESIGVKRAQEDARSQLAPTGNAIDTRTAQAVSATNDLALINKYIKGAPIQNEEEDLRSLIDAVNRQFGNLSVSRDVPFTELELDQVAKILGTSVKHIGEDKTYQIAFDDGQLYITKNGQKTPLIDHVREKRYRKLVADFKKSDRFYEIAQSIKDQVLIGGIAIAHSFEAEYVDPDFSQEVNLQQWIYSDYYQLENGAIKREFDDEIRYNQAAIDISRESGLAPRLASHYTTYLYDDQDIAKVTRSLKGQDASSSGSFYDQGNKTIFALRAIDYFTQNHDDLRRGVDNIANTILELHANNGITFPYKIVFPVNFGGGHWASGLIQVSGLGASMEIHDPMGPFSFADQQRSQIFQELLQSKCGIEINEFNATGPEQGNHKRQHDSVSCGPICAREMIILSQGDVPTDPYPDYHPQYRLEDHRHGLITVEKITKSFVEQKLRFLQNNSDFQRRHNQGFLNKFILNPDSEFENFKQLLLQSYAVNFTGLDQQTVNKTIIDFIRAGFTVDASERSAGGNSDIEVQHIKIQLQEIFSGDIEEFIIKCIRSGQVSGGDIEEEFLKTANQELKNLIFKNPEDPSSARIKDHDSLLNPGVIVAFMELAEVMQVQESSSLLDGLSGIEREAPQVLTTARHQDQVKRRREGQNIESLQDFLRKIKDLPIDDEHDLGFEGVDVKVCNKGSQGSDDGKVIKIKGRKNTIYQYEIHEGYFTNRGTHEDKKAVESFFDMENSSLQGRLDLLERDLVTKSAELTELEQFLQKTSSNEQSSSNELVGRLIAEVDKNKDNPNPGTPYRGTGIKSQLMAQGSEDNMAYFLQIEDIFPPLGDRFSKKVSDGAQDFFVDPQTFRDEGIIGGKITEVFVDGGYKTITKIINSSKDMQSALQQIAKIFHDPNSVKFKVESAGGGEVEEGSVIEITCDNSRNSASVFAPDKSASTTSDFQAISSMTDAEKLEILNGLSVSRGVPSRSPAYPSDGRGASRSASIGIGGP